MDGGHERRLIRAAQRGSAPAAEELARRHAKRAWRSAFALTGCRDLADEVSQEAMARAFRSLKGFDSRRPFAPWLHRIVLNCARDALGRRQPEVPLPEEVAAWPGVDREELIDLLGALAELDPARREVVVLRHVGGFGSSEIAEILGAAEGTVHSRLARGLADLRLALRGGRP